MNKADTRKTKTQGSPQVRQEAAPRRQRIDEPFTILVLLLVAVGLITLFSASYSVGYHYHDGNSTHYAFRQGLFAAAGIVVMFAASRINYQKLHYFAVPLMVFTLEVMSSIKWMPSIWQTINDATRWINLGFTTVQPSEIAKFAVILLFSSLATIWGPKKMRTLKHGIVPFIGIIGVIVLMLVWEKHLSAMVIIGVIGIVLMFLGGASMFYLVCGGGAGVAGVFAYIATKGYANARILAWLNPFDPAYFHDTGWQGAQSLMTIGSGGLWGLGLGQGRQKHLFLPEPANDFIFPVICEELGFIGAMLIIIAFVALICRGYYIAFNAEDKFGTLLAAGITTQIAIQVIMNLFVVTGLMPVTGVSLPFFSYGGTSLLMLLGEVGILLSVSRGMRVPSDVQ